MKRRINFTKRRQLLASHVEITLEPPTPTGAAPRFGMKLSIPAEWKLQSNSKVYVEPYVKSTSMRFDFGTVAFPVAPEDTVLEEVDPGTVLFRVKIVDESQAIGLLLASADALRPREHGEGTRQRSILPLRSRDLENQIWSVEITNEEGPVLSINNRLPGLRERLLTEPLLQGMVFPAALRQVLLAAFGPGEFVDEDWASDWREFVKALGIDALSDPDEEMDLSTLTIHVEEAVKKFCDAKQFGELARALLEGENLG